MEIHDLFGKRLRELRIRTGLTQEGLKKAAMLSPATISNIERGAYAPTFRRLHKLAQAPHIGMHELFIFSREKQE